MDEATDSTSDLAFCLFSSESRPFGVPLKAVAEVIEPGRLIRLPLCPRQVIGLCTHRGKVIPVISLGTEESSRPGAESEVALLILKGANGLWGLAVDRAGVTVELARFSAVDMPLMPKGFSASGSANRGEVAHAILDPDRSWRGLKSEIERWYGAVLGIELTGTPQPSLAV